MKLELRGVTKKFGDFVANDAIDLVIEPGQIHALLGENGAGKSTLMNVLFGLYEADAGEILIDDVPVQFDGPRQAMEAGIGMVHQHFMLIPVFTVAENVVMGNEPIKMLDLIDTNQARRTVTEISDRFGFDVDPDALIEDLPVGVQQRVEIIKALSRQASILILDEPTAVLTPQETDELMEIMRQLKKAGTSIVFITHKLREVKEVADTITVIRRGKVVGTASPKASQNELAQLMVGHSVALTVEKKPPELKGPALDVHHLCLLDPDGRPLLDDVSLTVERGEILAVAGVQGNGQTELAETLVGLRRPTAGSIKLDNHELAGLSVHDVLAAGVGFVAEDRSTDGMIADFTVAENLVLDQIDEAPFSKAGALDLAAIAEHARHQIEEFDVRTQSADVPISTLSGGNQQKVVLARELSRELRLLIASQPTRGVDVGSIEFIHQRIVAERDVGTPVIIVSTELDEVLALADKIAVMYRGRVVDVVPPTTSRGVLGLMMAGASYEDALKEEAAAAKKTAAKKAVQKGDDHE
ncbi:MAG: ABC transporter ATP-binding protein [Propionibacteriaceae bacterium]|nr:ABC transporter ATP-binding protein [Propionibacteriaceae bacterium]